MYTGWIFLNLFVINIEKVSPERPIFIIVIKKTNACKLSWLKKTTRKFNGEDK